HIDLFSASLSIGPRRVQRSSGLLELKWWPSPSSTFGRGSFYGTPHRPAIDPARRAVQVVSDPSSPFLLTQVRGLFPLQEWGRSERHYVPFEPERCCSISVAIVLRSGKWRRSVCHRS